MSIPIQDAPEIHSSRFTARLQRSDALLLVAFLGSGISALGLELIWLRVLALAFGSESFGMLGVLAGFFAGLAAGASVLHRTILRSRRPVRIYIAAECLVAAYAVAGPHFMSRLAESGPRVIGQWVGDNSSLAALSVNLLIAMLVLLPPTFCMGATTAALVEAWQRRRTSEQNSNTVAWLYASNTFGATLGIGISTYWLLPVDGIQATSNLLAGVSLGAAALAWVWERRGAGAGYRGAPAAIAVEAGESDPARLRPVYVALFFTGLAGIGIETVGTHVLAQILENTVYSFANILAIYLLGTALGAWLYTLRPVRARAANRGRFTGFLLYALFVSGVVAGALLARAPQIIARLAPRDSGPWHLPSETAVIALIFLPLTVVMGATFSHLLTHFTNSGVGYAAALNTGGAALAPFVFGLVLLPSAGYGVAYYSAVALYFALFVLVRLRRRPAVIRIATEAGAAVLLLALSYSSLVLIRLPSNTRLLDREIGLSGVISIVETGTNTNAAFHPRILLVDQAYQMGGSPGGVEKRMGHLPILLAAEPRNVLYLGTGTGITAGAAVSDGVDRITSVELVPEMLDLLPWFGEFNSTLHANQHVTLHASDARRFVRATRETYDLISADLYHPSRDGTASLYTREHLLGIRKILRRDGVFVQWLPIYQMSPRDLKTIVRTFLEVFPDADSVIGNYSLRATFGLIGTAPGETTHAGIVVARAEQLLAQSKGPGEVFEGIPDLLGSYMLDAEGLRRYAGPGPVNTDDNQRVAFDAGATAGIGFGDANDSSGSLKSLLPFRRPFPDPFVRLPAGGDLTALRRNAEKYGDAATHYLTAEFRLRETKGNTIPEDATAEYLRAYEEDVRFTSALRRLLALAIVYPNEAGDIVARLWSAHPDQAAIGALHAEILRVTTPEQQRAAISRFLQGAE